MDPEFIKYLSEVRGFRPGQQIQTKAEFDSIYRDYAKYRHESLTAWKTRDDPTTGRRVRENPVTGLTMDMTNAVGSPMGMAGDGKSANPYGDYINPTGVAGADAATNGMTNSMAFQGVQPTAAPAGNPVVPVNVSPSAPQGAWSMGQGGQPSPSPTPTPAAAAMPAFRTEDDVVAAARAGKLSKSQAQEILVKQFGLDP